MIGPLVVKVGGSLLDWPPLGLRLGSYLRGRQDERLVVIVGGGRAADLVRDLDAAHGLGDARAHHLALRALDLTAHALTALVSGLRVVERTEALTDVWQSGRIPVLAPRLLLDDDDREAPDPLDRSWDVTTDSIAARVAVRLGAAELALLKSASLPPGSDRQEAAQRGLVDPAFPEVAKPLERVTYLNLRDPEGSAVLLPQGRSIRDERAGQACLTPWKIEDESAVHSCAAHHSPRRKPHGPFPSLVLTGEAGVGQNPDAFGRSRSLPNSPRSRPMSQPVLVPLDRPEVARRPISHRLRTQLVYFMSAPNATGMPALGENEYWFDADDVARWLDEGVFHLVSPLDTANMTEVELTEEQEALLNWLATERVRHVRVVE